MGASSHCGDVRLLLLLGGVKPGAMLFPHLFCRNDSAAKVCELRKFLLDGLQPFMPLAVSDVILCPALASSPKLLI